VRSLPRSEDRFTTYSAAVNFPEQVPGYRPDLPIKEKMTDFDISLVQVAGAKTARVKLMFSLIYILFMSARAIFSPFITVFLREKGMTIQRIGLIMAVNSAMIIMAQPFWGFMSDKLQSVKKVLLICLVSQAVIVLLFIHSHGFLIIALCFCVYTFFSSSEGTLLDIWSLDVMKQVDKSALGQVKFWGCLGFAVSSIFMGNYIDKNSTTEIIPFFSAVLLGTAMIVFFVRTGNERPVSSRPKLHDLSQILCDRQFILYLIFAVIMQFPHRAAYTFYPTRLESLGGSKAMVGYCSAIMFVSEAIFLFLSKRLLGRVAPKYVIVGSALFFMLWQIGYIAAAKPVHIMVLALLDGPSFALFTIGTLYYLDTFAPRQLKATYQTLAHASYFGIGGIIGNTLGGWIIGRFGYTTMYILGVIVIAMATFLFVSAGRISAIAEKRKY
jgi:PPP family 3-phenylpropionic acid transporter